MNESTLSLCPHNVPVKLGCSICNPNSLCPCSCHSINAVSCSECSVFHPHTLSGGNQTIAKMYQVDTKSNEYKNGFNRCCEVMLQLIDKKLHATTYPHDSIYSALLDLKESLLKESFK